MRHATVHAWLSAYLEDDLAPRDRARLEAHLVECDPCRAELRGLRRTLALLHDLPDPEPSVDLADRVLARVRLEGAGRAPGWRARLARLLETPWAPPLAAAAAALAVVLLVQGGDPSLRSAATAPTLVAEQPVPAPLPAPFAEPGAPSGTRLAATPLPPGTRRGGSGATRLVSSVSPPETPVRVVRLPSLSECVRDAGGTPSERDLDPDERNASQRWYSWMMDLTPSPEPGRAPSASASPWLRQLAGRPPASAAVEGGERAARPQAIGIRFEQPAGR
jgi:hypothetical protein